MFKTKLNTNNVSLKNIGIKLNSNGKISEPSGERVTATMLKESFTYLHSNLYNYRKIEEIDGDTVYWKDPIGPGRCSKNAFINSCKYLITNEEKNLIDKSGIGDNAPKLEDYLIKNGVI